MDKTKNDPGTLVHYRESICSGSNPTPGPWQRRLQWAPLIDNLLADASWVRIWRALRDAAGDMALVAEMLHVDSSSLRGFKYGATQAAIEFNESSMTSRTLVVSGTRRASLQPSRPNIATS